MKSRHIVYLSVMSIFVGGACFMAYTGHERLAVALIVGAFLFRVGGSNDGE